MLETLSPRRLELLRRVHKHGVNIFNEQPLERDYKNVYLDAAVLEATGLLIRDGRKLSAPWGDFEPTSPCCRLDAAAAAASTSPKFSLAPPPAAAKR